MGMFFWVGFPFLRYVLCLILGVILGKYLNTTLSFLILPIAVSYAVLTVVFHRFPSVALRILNGVLLMTFFIVFGNGIWQESRMPVPEFENCQAYQARVSTVLKFDSASAQYQLEVQAIRRDSAWSSAQGIVLLTLQGPSSYLPGDLLLVRGSPYRLQSRADPGSFDYVAYLAERQIYYRDKVSVKNIFQLERGSGISFRATRLRRQGLNYLRQSIRDPDNLGILQALVLGYKKDLSPEIRNSWSGTGSMHVLAVSGLHVGMIYLFLNYLMAPLKSFRLGRVLFVILSLILITAYAMLTGLSASVLRASLMISIVILSQNLRQQANIFNSIALSAFVLITYDPSIIFQLGFQLSYLAVLGIVVLYPFLKARLNSRYWILDKILALTSVSLAAQISTLPLLIYSFHQLPSYGLISNLLVIPSAFILLLGSMLGLLLSFLPELSSVIFECLEIYLDLLNACLDFLFQLPVSIVEFTSWSLTNVFISYGIIFGIAGILIARNSFFLYLTSIFLILRLIVFLV